jgi:MFS transporter, AAHS family, 4-hydroxybenzoate transporter
MATIGWEENGARKLVLNLTDVIEHQRLSRFQLTTIALCIFVAVLDGFDTQCIGLLAPAIAQSLGFDLHAFGPVFGAGLFGLMLGSLVMGPVADRWGRRWALIGSTLSFGVLSALTPIATSLDQLMILRFLTGLGLGGAIPNVVALTAEYAPTRLRTTLVATIFCGMPLGAVLGSIVSALLLPRTGWSSVFYVGGALPMLIALVLIAKLPESVRFLILKGANHLRIARIMARLSPGLSIDRDLRFIADAPQTGFPIRNLFTDGRAIGTLLLWVPYLMNLLILYFIVSWMPAMLMQAQMPITAGITAITLFSVGGIIGSLGQGRVMSLLGEHRTMIVEFVCSIALIAALGLLPISYLTVMSIILLLGVTVQGAQAGLNALVAGFYPTEMRSTGIGWAFGIGRIGSIIGPTLGGVLLSLSWEPRQIFLSGTLPAIAAVIALGLFSRISGDRTPCRMSRPA